MSVLKMLSIKGMCSKVLVNVVKKCHSHVSNVVSQHATGNLFHTRIMAFSVFDIGICV